MTKRVSFITICMILVFVFSACGGDSGRLVGTWSGLVGEISAFAWRYEFNRDGTGTWGDARNAATELVWDWDLGRYVNPWDDFNVTPTNWSISGDSLEIAFVETGSVFIYHFEIVDNDTIVLQREGWPTGLVLTRVD
jgi:hypothetical protein